MDYFLKIMVNGTVYLFLLGNLMVLVTVNPRPLHVGTILRGVVLIVAVLNKEGLAGTENVVHRKIRGNFSVGGFSLGNTVIESELSEEED